MMEKAFTYNDLMLVFARRLRQAIEKSGLSVKQVAASIYVDRTTVYYYQQGVRLPGAMSLRLLADVLHVSVDWLLGREINNE